MVRKNTIGWLLLSGLALASVAGAADAPSDPRSNAVVESSEAEFVAPMHGVALPKLQSTIVAQVSGMITAVSVDEGQRVQAGEALLVLDPSIAQAQVEIAKVTAGNMAGIRAAELDLELAMQHFHFVSTAHKAQAGTDTELLTARIQRDRAQTKLDQEQQNQAEAVKRLALAEAELARHTIRAPFEGRVVRLFTPLGANAIESATNLVTVAALQELEVELYLPLERFGRVHVKDELTLQAAAPINRKITAIVKSVAPVIDPATRSVRCVLTVDNADEKLPSGFAVELVIHSR